MVERKSVTPIRDAINAYDKLYLYKSPEAKQTPSTRWKTAAVALRNNIVCHAWTETGSDKSEHIEAALKEVYGVRFAGNDRDLRSQLKKCIRDTFSGGKPASEAHRTRGNNRSNVGAGMQNVVEELQSHEASRFSTTTESVPSPEAVG